MLDDDHALLEDVLIDLLAGLLWDHHLSAF